MALGLGERLGLAVIGVGLVTGFVGYVVMDSRLAYDMGRVVAYTGLLVLISTAVWRTWIRPRRR